MPQAFAVRSASAVGAETAMRSPMPNETGGLRRSRGSRLRVTAISTAPNSVVEPIHPKGTDADRGAGCRALG